MKATSTIIFVGRRGTDGKFREKEHRTRMNQ